VRRILLVLLILGIAAAPLALPVGADSSTPSTQPVKVTLTAAQRHSEAVGQATLQRAHLDAVATRHDLAVAAATVRVSIVQLRVEWQQVAICEVGGNWAMTGPAYSGIGFLNATWNAYGGARYAPLAGQATRDQQILIGMKVTSGRVPDQNGCSPTGW
jgi:hypothetical protein